MSVSASTTSSATPVRASPPSAVVPSETILSPSRRGLAPAQSGTVSRCEENKRRGPGRVPSSSTIQIARLGGQGNALVGVVEADRGSGHADFPQGIADGGDLRFLPGHSLDREETHQMLFGSGDVEGNGGCAQ